MIDKGASFDIISFTADSRQYYPAAMGRQSWMPDNYVPHTAMKIALGQSRYGGPVIDLPPGLELPAGLRFAAQLDLAQFSPFDQSGLLPASGQLLFFADIRSNKGKVIYGDVPNNSLVRTIEEHEADFFSGVLVDRVFADTESFAGRFRAAEDERDREHADADGVIWDYFAGSERSKIFGIYTHCQYEREDIEQISVSGRLLLLQIGGNGFNDEGVFSVLIDRQDLVDRNFDHCTFAWGQS